MAKEYNVVYISDYRYILPLVVSVVSLCENLVLLNEDTCNIYIICNQVSDEYKNKIKSINYPKINIIIIDVNNDSLIEGIVDIDEHHVTKSACYKFFIPNILNNVEIALYLDCDVIINKDIRAIFEYEINDVSCAVVEKPLDGDSLGKRIGLEEGKYFNTGVMLMNLKMMRDKMYPQKLFEYKKKHQNLSKLMDQDVFNIVLNNDVLYIPTRYNFLMSLFMYHKFEEINMRLFNDAYISPRDCIFDQVVIHCVDKYKPWDYEIPYFSEIFMKYYSKSFFGNERLNLVSLLYQLNKNNYELIYKNKMWSEGIIDYRFPYERIDSGSRIIIYGAGAVGKTFMEELSYTHYCEVIMWVDTNWKEINNENIKDPDLIKNSEYDSILIAVSSENYVNEICEFLNGLGVVKDKIVSLFKE
ncbi:glycosyltransferase family 8 protein [Pseudobutyrivibrio sp. LB2011]|uniref:glycosyltransferase family 8 protein n=1 Tax=Pseudobutyrivibrio sp. LB2011 TaxID=1408312 RepID=UPI0005D1D29F|nr:glycosyltransferase family 8 protein [Pseudobutyrivibrio sp. LB2011]